MHGTHCVDVDSCSLNINRLKRVKRQCLDLFILIRYPCGRLCLGNPQNQPDLPCGGGTFEIQ